MLCQLNCWLVNSILGLQVQIWQNLFIFKKATLGNEKLNVIKEREHHKLPIDCFKNFSFSCNYQITVVPVINLVIKSISSWIFDLQILSGNEETHQRDKDSVIFFIFGDFWGVDVHQMNSMMDCLVLTLKGVCDVAQVVNSFYTFL